MDFVMGDSRSVYLLICIVVARLDLEGAQAIQTEELIVEEDVDYVLSVGEERIALQPKTLQDEPVKELISVRNNINPPYIVVSIGYKNIIPLLLSLECVYIRMNMW